MRNLSFFILFLLCGFLPLIAQSDYITNPSCSEGMRGWSVTPPSWHSCNDLATPDTGPYFSDLPATDGNTYVGLVMRGLMNPEPKNEDVVTKLIKPILRDSIYFLSLDMALAPYVFDVFSGETLYYDNPARLRISGGNDSCLMNEVFFVSDIIKDSLWNSYDLEVIPKSNTIKYLKLEIYLDIKRAAYINIDNIVFDKLKILGMDNVCQGDQNVEFRVPLISCTSDYNWNYTGNGVTIVGDSNKVSLNFDDQATSGNLTVSFNYCNERTITLSFPVVVDSRTSGLPGNIIGPQEVCQGQQMVAYYASNSNSGVYNWNVDVPWATYSNYDDSILINFSMMSESGIITLSGNNACKSELPITVRAMPETPDFIVGDDNVCQNQNNVLYTVPIIGNSNSYLWSFSGDGTSINILDDSIYIDFSRNATSGLLCVRGNNECGSGNRSPYLYINVNSMPTAGEISGVDRVCKNQNGSIYQVFSIQNASEYIWDYSGTGETIVGNSSSVEINFSEHATSGNLTVSGINGCGEGLPSVPFPITVDSIPVSPGTIFGDNEICVYRSSSFYVTKNNNVLSYNWNYSGSGAEINNSEDSVVIIFTRVENSGELTVSGTNGCGIGESSPPLSIIVDPCDLIIPNSFSPNGDGINDYFEIINLPEYAHLIIFDRLGRLMYESENYLNDWNGDDKEQNKLPSDTYWYVLTALRNPTEYKGYVYIKR